MNTKYKLIITAAVLGLAVTLLAAEQPANTTLRIIRLKSNGETIAEIKILKGTLYKMTSKETQHDKANDRLTAKGDVQIEIKRPGGVPITMKAEEVEVVPPDAK